MLKVGIAGFGFMGRMHYKCWKALDGVEIVALCDSNPNIVDAAAKAIGNIEGADAVAEISGVAIFADFDEMLRETQPDAISLTLPTYLHADYSIKALESGVHVLCEKPMALSVHDCERMTAAAKSTGKTLQIGHCIRFWPEYVTAKQIVDSGRYGKVIAATFQRLASAPTWSHDNWFLDEKLSGGMALDLHIHDTDFVQYLFGVPLAVCSFGARGSRGGPSGAGSTDLTHIVTQYIYDDEKVVTAEGSWAMMPGFGFEMSFNIILEEATIVYDLTRSPMLKLYPEQGPLIAPEVPQGDGYSRQIHHFASLIRGENVPPVTTLEQSLNSVKIVEAEKESASRKQQIPLK